jgi:hypothetical protein
VLTSVGENIDFQERSFRSGRADGFLIVAAATVPFGLARPEIRGDRGPPGGPVRNDHVAMELVDDDISLMTAGGAGGGHGAGPFFRMSEKVIGKGWPRRDI